MFVAHGGETPAGPAELLVVLLVPGGDGHRLFAPDHFQPGVEALTGLRSEVVEVTVVVGDHVAGEHLAIRDAEYVALTVGGKFLFRQERTCSAVVIPEILRVGDEGDESRLRLPPGIPGVGGDPESAFYRGLDGRKFEGNEELRVGGATPIGIDGIEEQLCSLFFHIEFVQSILGIAQVLLMFSFQVPDEPFAVAEDLIPGRLAPGRELIEISVGSL